MEKTMMALVAYGPRDYRYEPFPCPALGEGDILLKVKGCGICAGDIKELAGLPDTWGTGKGDMLMEPPEIPGHEFCGEIVEMAPDVTGYALGDLLVAEQIVPCGRCEDCRRGEYWMCSEMQLFGLKNIAHGGFAEYVKIPAAAIKHKLPKGFTTEQGALVEPYACGMHAAERAAVRHTDVVAVGGLGAIGCAITNVVRLSLPKLIIGIDSNEHRLELAKAFGAEVLLDPARCDVAEEIHRLTGGRGCDVYIEASGHPSSAMQGLRSLKNHGRFVQFGQYPTDVTANWNLIGDGKELTIVGSHLSAHCYAPVIRGIESGLLRTEGLISHTFKLQDWEEGFAYPKKDPAAMKIMLVP